MRSVNCQYVIAFAGEHFACFEVQEVLAAPSLMNAIRGDEDAQRAIVEQLLRTPARKQSFRRISPDLNYETIWQSRSEIIMKEWDV